MVKFCKEIAGEKKEKEHGIFTEFVSNIDMLGWVFWESWIIA
jgi:hypothetical protein